MDKRGVSMIIVGFIIAIIVLGIGIFFLGSILNPEDTNREACRQSILLRANMPSEWVGDVKSAFPLKCKTEVIKINSDDKQKILKTIADEAASDYYLVGEGKFNIFPKKYWSGNSYCLIFSRISFGDKTKEKFSSEGINMLDYLKKTGYKEDMTYFEYFNTAFAKHPETKKDYPKYTNPSSNSFDENYKPIIDLNKDLFIVFRIEARVYGLYLGDSVPLPRSTFYIGQNLAEMTKDCSIETIPA